MKAKRKREKSHAIWQGGLHGQGRPGSALYNAVYDHIQLVLFTFIPAVAQRSLLCHLACQHDQPQNIDLCHGNRIQLKHICHLGCFKFRSVAPSWQSRQIGWKAYRWENIITVTALLLTIDCDVQTHIVYRLLLSAI